MKRALRWAWVLLVAVGPAVGAAAAQGTGGIAALELRLLDHPADAALYLRLAAEYETAGRGSEAEAVLRLGITRAAAPDPVRTGLVELLARHARWDDALLAVEPLRVTPAGRSVAARIEVNAGLEALRAGRRSEARHRWERALADDPALSEAAGNLGAFLLEAGERDSARSVAVRALRRHPDDARLLALRAAATDGADGLVMTITALRRLRTSRPGDEALGLALARGLTAAGERAAAGALLDSLVASPRSSEAAYRAGIAFCLDGGLLDAATTLAQRATDRWAQSGALWALLGEAQAGRGAWREASVAYRRAIGLDVTPEEAALPLALVYLSAGDTAAALDVLRELRAGAPPRAALVAAAAYAEAAGALTLADSTCDDLLHRDGFDGAALECAGALAERLGDNTRAVALYRRALALDSAGPQAPLALLRLARPAGDSGTLLLRRAVWSGLNALQASELSMAATIGDGSSARAAGRAAPFRERGRALVALVRMALDTAVFLTPWGEALLGQLRLAYPQSVLLERYQAELDTRRGRDSLALARYDVLVMRQPADAGLQRQRAELLARRGTHRDAALGLARALDLEPESEPTFRLLVQLHQRDGTLTALLAQLERLRVGLPDSRPLAERQVEVLQRLGRIEEAAAVAQRMPGARP